MRKLFIERENAPKVSKNYMNGMSYGESISALSYLEFAESNQYAQSLFLEPAALATIFSKNSGTGCPASFAILARAGAHVVS